MAKAILKEIPETIAFCGLVAVVQVRQSGTEAWWTMAAFDVEEMAIRYMIDRVDNGYDYRVLKVRR